MNEKKIVEVNYGIASSYDDFIEINRKLRDPLRKKILDHELRHDSGKYSVKDFKNDFQSKKPHFFESFSFALRNPEALINYFPFMYSYYRGILTYNYTALFPFLYYGIIFSVFFLVVFKISLFKSFIGWVVIFGLINIFLLVYTHYYVKNHP